MKKRKGDFTQAGLAMIVGVLIMVIVIAVTMWMAKGSQGTFKKANKKSAESAMSLFE